MSVPLSGGRDLKKEICENDVDDDDSTVLQRIIFRLKIIKMTKKSQVVSFESKLKCQKTKCRKSSKI